MLKIMTTDKNTLLFGKQYQKWVFNASKSRS